MRSPPSFGYELVRASDSGTDHIFILKNAFFTHNQTLQVHKDLISCVEFCQIKSNAYNFSFYIYPSNPICTQDNPAFRYHN